MSNIKGYRKYKHFDPYFTVGIDLLNGRRPVPTHNTFYVEVRQGQTKPEQRYKYRTFEKGADKQAPLQSRAKESEVCCGQQVHT